MNKSHIEFQELTQYLRNHVWHKKIFGRINQTELEIVENFIHSFGDLNRMDFEMKLNRFFLDQPNKPKHWIEISEILSIFNSRRTING